MYHNFHVLNPSCYPYLVFCCSLGFFSSLVFFFYSGFLNYFVFFSFFFVIFLWFKDICSESLGGFHNFFVLDGFKLGLFVFIFSEFMFFFGIFWSYFDFFFGSFLDFASFFYVYGFYLVNPFGIPFLNSVILLSSAVSVTWGHYLLLLNKSPLFSIFLTIFLCVYFVSFRVFEYFSSFFCISDGFFGSVFFFSTGFHGFHVLLGGIFLIFNFFRFFFFHFSFFSHLGFEFSILYWHFVDIIWLFLYVFFYFWVF